MMRPDEVRGANGDAPQNAPLGAVASSEGRGLGDGMAARAGTSPEVPALRCRVVDLGHGTSQVELPIDYRDDNTDGSPWLRVTVEWDGEPFDGRDGSWLAEAFETDGKGGWKDSPEGICGTLGYGATKEEALGMLIGSMLANVYLYKGLHRKAEEQLQSAAASDASEAKEETLRSAPAGDGDATITDLVRRIEQAVALSRDDATVAVPRGLLMSIRARLLWETSIGSAGDGVSDEVAAMPPLPAAVHRITSLFYTLPPDRETYTVPVSDMREMIVLLGEYRDKLERHRKSAGQAANDSARLDFLEAQRRVPMHVGYDVENGYTMWPIANRNLRAEIDAAMQPRRHRNDSEGANG